jgi:hypothetical protein
MDDVKTQPFLLMLKQAKYQTDNFESFISALQEHQEKFKDDVSEYFFSDRPASKRYHFLLSAMYELSSIRSHCGRSIKEHYPAFYVQWKLLIDDTKSYVSINVDTINFQRRCPAHMSVEQPAQAIPLWIWAAPKIDLAEVLVGLHHVNVIRFPDGSRPSFPLFLKSVGGNFGVTFDEPSKVLKAVIDRKRNNTPFFDRIITILKYRNFDKDDTNY